MRKLEDKETDTFLVRCSSTVQGQFAISRTVEDSHNKTQSTRIAQAPSGFGEGTNNVQSGPVALPSQHQGQVEYTAMPKSNPTTTSPSQRRKGLRDSNDIIQTKKFESLPELVMAIVDELDWKHCPGSPFSSIFDPLYGDPLYECYVSLPHLNGKRPSQEKGFPDSPLKHAHRSDS